MSAGPYPTKAMFEGLKGRVGALEGTSGGGEVAPGSVYFDASGSPAASGAREILISWQRRSVAVAGLELWGNVTLTSLTVAGPNRGAGITHEFPAEALTRTVENAGSGLQTRFRLPETLLLTDGYITAYLGEGSGLLAYPAASGAPPAGTGITVSDVNGNPLPNAFLRAQVLEVPQGGPLIVPEPTPLDFDGEETPPRDMEIVWPASGAPYLHVFRHGSASGYGESFHVPLTPGLPQ